MERHLRLTVIMYRISKKGYISVGHGVGMCVSVQWRKVKFIFIG